MVNIYISRRTEDFQDYTSPLAKFWKAFLVLLTILWREGKDHSKDISLRITLPVGSHKSGSTQHQLRIVMNSDLLKQAETSEVSFSSTAKGSRKEIFAYRMKKRPGISVSFSMNTVIVFPNISPKDCFWVTIIAYNHVFFFPTFLIILFVCCFCSGNLLNMMEIKYKSCALLTTEPSPQSKNL